MRRIATTLLMTVLAGCAGLPQTADQVITLDTSPKVPSTHCVASNEITSANVYATPSRFTILRGKKPLVINCSSPMGWRGNAVVAAGPALSTTFLGTQSETVRIGSDAALPEYAYQGNPATGFDGTLNRYPGTIIVPMVRADR